ncbi:hypothetical protein LENED_003530 [Lentinula edodes]|uniref:Uncharacterized protein n=1 Tax=Lentinula edodes TaxID=5353 RepID=A0A1Q3E3S0_LENED|nr:hypothetical protein LENED_003530 [Lentinula edodes]
MDGGASTYEVSISGAGMGGDTAMDTEKRCNTAVSSFSNATPCMPCYFLLVDEDFYPEDGSQNFSRL